jgi:hypothetical protein
MIDFINTDGGGLIDNSDEDKRNGLFEMLENANFGADVDGPSSSRLVVLDNSSENFTVVEFKRDFKGWLITISEGDNVVAWEVQSDGLIKNSTAVVLDLARKWNDDKTIIQGPAINDRYLSMINLALRKGGVDGTRGSEINEDICSRKNQLLEILEVE